LSKVKIIADSMSDIPKGLQDKLNIKVIPLTVRFGDEEYKDGVDLTSEEFYKKLEESDVIPSTSQVPPQDFTNAIKEAFDEGYESVIIVNGSSQVSGTHQSAIIAKEEFKENVYVVDTRALSYGCGIIVTEAAKMAQKGMKAEEILSELNKNVLGKIEHIFTVDTLKYLHKNGRLSASSMALGTLLNVKPILNLRDGKVEPLEKVRGNKKAYKRMIEIALERGLERSTRISVGHAENLEGANVLIEEIKKIVPNEEIEIADIGCTIGSHTGRGTLAMFFKRNS